MDWARIFSLNTRPFLFERKIKIMTEKLEGFQRKYLRGLAHKKKPVVFVGQKGLTETLNGSINDALTAHD